MVGGPHGVSLIVRELPTVTLRHVSCRRHTPGSSLLLRFAELQPRRNWNWFRAEFSMPHRGVKTTFFFAGDPRGGPNTETDSWQREDILFGSRAEFACGSPNY